MTFLPRRRLTNATLLEKFLIPNIPVTHRTAREKPELDSGLDRGHAGRTMTTPRLSDGTNISPDRPLLIQIASLRHSDFALHGRHILHEIIEIAHPVNSDRDVLLNSICDATRSTMPT